MVAGEPGRSAPRIVGRYIVYGELASGGMATVHFGRLTGVAGFARSVAIKRLHPQFARDPEFVRMFLDEARLAARITHPNVVSTLDVVATNDELLLVMEYIRGVSLSQLARIVRHGGKHIPPLIATGIMAGVLHGLHAAHDARSDRGERLDIVHRDVSPQNVIVGTDGIPRVLDFGVAKAAGRLQTTRDGQLKGKLSYMAPEQIHGATVTRRTDIYSASVVLWEVLTGERLFRGDNEANVLARILSGEVSAPSSVVPAIAKSLDRIVLRGLKLEPGARYATAREMAQDLNASYGVASAHEIGDWVEEVASQELGERERRIAEIEEDAAQDLASDPSTMISSPGRGAPDLPTPVGRRTPEVATNPAGTSPLDPTSQVSSVSLAQVSAAPPPRKGRGRWIAVAVAGSLLAVLAIVAVGVTRGQRQPRTAAASTLRTTTATATPSATPAPTPTATWTAVPMPSAAPTASPPVIAKPQATTMTPPARPVAAKGADCSPPYTTDDKGHVHFKPQCM